MFAFTWDRQKAGRFVQNQKFAILVEDIQRAGGRTVGCIHVNIACLSFRFGNSFCVDIGPEESTVRSL